MAGRQYRYTTLYEAAKLPKTDESKIWEVNVCAVILECDVARQTKGTDMVVNIKLTDPSIHDPNATWDWPTNPPQQGIELLLFARRRELLPSPEAAGQLIRLHRLKAGTFNNKPQLVGNVSKQSAACLYDRGAAPGAEPMWSTSRHAFVGGNAHERLLATLKPLANKLYSEPLEELRHYLRLLEQLHPPEGPESCLVDICCQVVAVDQRDPAVQVLHIWDGTDAMPAPATLNMRACHPRGDSRTDELPLRQHRVPLKPEEGLQLGPLPPLGTCVPVIIPAHHHRMELPVLGQPVKLKLAAVQYVAGQLQLVFTRSSRWSLRASPGWSGMLAERLQRRLEQGSVSSWAPADASQLGSSCGADQAWASVRQVLQRAAVEEGGRHRLLARLVGWEPTEPWCMCQRGEELQLEPHEWGPGGWVYAVRLLLEDATGRLDAVALAKDAEALFGPELPPADLATNHDAACRLRDVLRGLSDVVLLGAGAGQQGGAGAGAAAGGEQVPQAVGQAAGAGQLVVVGEAQQARSPSATGGGQEPAGGQGGGGGDVSGAQQGQQGRGGPQGDGKADRAAVQCVWLDVCVRHVVHGGMALFRLEGTQLRAR